jgi:cyanophycinase-like exopeptidase
MEEPELPPLDGSYGVEVVRQGATTDATPVLKGPSLLLQGDGTPLEAALRAHVRQVADRPLDVVVLAASFPERGGATPECDRLTDRSRLHSCTTIIIPDPRGADVQAVADTVRRAEVVYFAGGNQCNYVEWRGTAVHAAVKTVVERGGGVGGGSAGLAVQGDIVYDGCAGSVRSDEALSNPYHRRISFSDSVFAWPALDRVITDSHFAERDRMGRLLAFVARQTAGRADAFYGLGVNEATAVVIGPEQTGRVYGNRAYLVHAGHAPETVQPGTPLTYDRVSIVRLSPGATYDFAERPLDSAYVRSVESGELSANPYRP